jgi:hypothetical protein
MIGPEVHEFYSTLQINQPCLKITPKARYPVWCSTNENPAGAVGICLVDYLVVGYSPHIFRGLYPNGTSILLLE